jgi:hypothetical protein
MVSKNYFDTPLTVAKYLNEQWRDDARFVVMEKLLLEKHTGQRGFVFNIPPKMGKTSFAEAVILWQAASNPKSSIMYVANNFEAAEPMLNHVERDLEVMCVDTGEDFTMGAAGVLVPLESLTEKNLKFDYIIIDNPIVGWAAAEDLEFLDKQWQWTQELIKNHLAKNGTFIVLMPRWCPDDLTAKLIVPASKKDSVFKNIPVKNVVFQMVATEEIKVGNKTYIKPGDILGGGKDRAKDMQVIEEIKRQIGEEYYNVFFQQTV